MVLFAVSLVMFAFPLLILNMVNKDVEENSLIGDLTEWGPIDAVLKQYEEVLAGFGPQSHPDQAWLTFFIIIIFVFASLFT